MKSKILLSAISALLAFTALLSSCGTVPVDEVTVPTETEPLFPDDTTADIPEDNHIVYPEGELPKLYINTNDGKQVTSKDIYSACNVRLEMNGVYENYQNTYTDQNGGGALIRCRGNMTYNIADVKKTNSYSYKLKLDAKADLFGFGSSKHWYLINCWRDTSYLRHKLAYDLSASLGIEYTDCTWVSVYYNDEYRGLYLMTESIRIAEDRIEMENWEEFAEDVADAYATDNSLDADDALVLSELMEHNLSWLSTGYITANLPSGKRIIDLSVYFDPEELDLTSGYLIEICNGMDTSGSKWKTNAGFFIVLDSPFYLHSNSEMYNYVRTLIQDFEDAIMSPDFHNAKGKHYSEYIDVDSMVDYWMVWNFFVNTEFGARSMYFHIKDGKMIFGPNWDFDGTSGNIMSTTKSGGAYNKWVPDRSKTWFYNAMKDPWFTAKCQERWYSLSELLDDFMTSMDIYARYIKDGAAQSYERTGPRKEIVRQPDVNNGHSFNPWEDYEYLRTWFENRIIWLDEHFAALDPNIDGAGYTRSEKIKTALTLDSNTIEKDRSSVYGLNADYIISTSDSGVIEIKLTTTHSNIGHFEVYLNGTEFLGRVENTASGGSLLVDTSKLDMSDGALNVFYIMCYKNTGAYRSMSSVLIRVRSLGNPEAMKCIVQLGNEIAHVDRFAEYALPEITEEHNGFIAEGWTDGKNVYAPGTTIEIKNDVHLYIKWKRTYIFSIMEFFPQ
ncbi:MAG: CotH kinase family protein [Clostridia bacterium]|nr:CotH kinase family protein [Clostridia bacterium]